MPCSYSASVQVLQYSQYSYRTGPAQPGRVEPNGDTRRGCGAAAVLLIAESSSSSSSACDGMEQ